MAAMALHLRSKCRTLQNPRLVQLFSSSSDSNDVEDKSIKKNGDEDKKESQSPPPSQSVSSYFSDVKARLKQSPPPRRFSPTPPPPRDFPSFSSPKPSQDIAIEEIRKNLSEFRRRSSVPPPDQKYPPSSSPPISFQDLYKRNKIEKSDEANPRRGKLAFESISESLRQLRSSNANQPQNDRFRGQDNRPNRVDTYSLKSFRDNLKMMPDGTGAGNQSRVLGKSEVLPPSVFSKELGPKWESESRAMKTEFVKEYSYEELGRKLIKLRPTEAMKDKNWFSLEELNERLRKLREMEEKEMDSKMGGVMIRDLRECLVKLQMSDDDKKKRSLSQRPPLSFTTTPDYMLKPPKEHLVEKYFHPDNMSSEEKLKLELQRVREEFKMSESDCGSSRVQVAQLTTKIKHLSSVLHKKDKHSRKGLQAMVQKRKKLLKYMRRTDWPSYCLVLSKLGLRDNPDYKN